MQRLGQHFLKSDDIVSEIVKAAELKPDDIVLEVGPGYGILTEALLKTGCKITAVEKDKELVRYLRQKFVRYKNLNLVEGDILKFKNFDLFKNLKLKIKNFKIVANIPYYITSHFLRQFLTAKNQPEIMVLMVQKEVAERITAKPPDMSLLAISVQVYGRPKIIKTVPKTYFSPAPKVDSAIIKISDISTDFFNRKDVDEKTFFELVKKGFSHKRKTLKNNLKSILASCDDAILEKCKIKPLARAQELSLKDWICLYKNFF